jgi:hypothetical protein
VSASETIHIEFDLSSFVLQGQSSLNQTTFVTYVGVPTIVGIAVGCFAVVVLIGLGVYV